MFNNTIFILHMYASVWDLMKMLHRQKKNRYNHNNYSENNESLL